MADFARINSSNIVIDVQHIADSDAPTEAAGEAYCHSLFDNDHPNCTYKKCDPGGANGSGQPAPTTEGGDGGQGKIPSFSGSPSSYYAGWIVTGKQ